MANATYMTDNFESQKNFRASVYTAIICALIVALLLLMSWTLPVIQAPVVDEGIEVNLGNSDKGMGPNQPYLPGKPSAEDKEKYTPPKRAVVEKVAAKDVETDDNKNEDAPVVKKPAVTKPDATRIPLKDVDRKVVTVKKPETNPEPPKPKPKAVFHGTNGTGTGGNDADTYKPGGNEGIAGGKGDQGKPGGNPDSKNYTGGGTGNSGVRIKNGLEGRHITAMPSFTDDFNEKATVLIDIHVDATGHVTSADYHAFGSTVSAGSSLVDIAIRKAKLVKFNSANDESVGTLVFNFKLHN